jgi:hypothetical protein
MFGDIPRFCVYSMLFLENSLLEEIETEWLDRVYAYSVEPYMRR